MDKTEFKDKVKLFENENAVKARLEQLQEPHVKPLTDYVADGRHLK